MKTAVLLFSVLILGSFSVFAQDDENWFSRDYSVDNFSDVYLKGNFKVYLTQGKKATLSVKTRDEEMIDELDVDLRRSELVVDARRNYLPGERVHLYITFRDLSKLEVEGGLVLDTDGFLDLNDLALVVNGGAKVELKMKADDVEVIAEGGVLIELEGVAQSLRVEVSGAGHVDASDLKSEDVVFNIEGVGTGSVYATETLNASIEGVGKIRYNGNPRVTKNIEGVGSVSPD